MIKKLISSLLISASVMSLLPLSASAEWKQDNTGWWYTEGSSYSTGWKSIDNMWYYFDQDGYMKTGWFYDGGKWYYLVPNGNMKTGWMQDGDTWYYMDESGAMITGTARIDNKTYKFDNNGKWIDTSSDDESKDKTNPVVTEKKDNKVSAKPSDAALKAAKNYSWFTEDNRTYFKLDGDNYATSCLNIDGVVYCFDGNGMMITGEYTDSQGVKYLFDADGKYNKCITKDKYRLYVSSAVTTKSGTSNSNVEFFTEPLNIVHIYSSDPEKAEKLNKYGSLDLKQTQSASYSAATRTLTCKTNETVELCVLEVRSADKTVHGLPNLKISADTSDEDIAFAGIDLFYADGYMGQMDPSIIARKPGKATITIDVNGTKYPINVVVTE